MFRTGCSCAGNQYLATRIVRDTLKVNTDAMLSLYFECMLGVMSCMLLCKPDSHCCPLSQISPFTCLLTLMMALLT